jgi:hypothetical protein
MFATVIQVLRVRPVGGNDYWSVCFDYGTPTNPSDARTRYHWTQIQDERGKYPVKPYRVGEKVNVDEI